MTEPTEYKTREDGTIDYAHYMARGREMRSAAFLTALRKLRHPRAGTRKGAAKPRGTHTPIAMRLART